MTNVQKELVSTIIPVFNRPELIVSAVDSVLQQTYRPIEIIIVDDGSDDHTPDVIDDLVKKHSEVVSFRQANAGPGVARELGRQQATGSFIQYLDSDDRLLPNKFELQVLALIDNQEADVAYGKTDRRLVESNQSMQAWKSTGEQISTMFPTFLKSRWWGTSSPLYRRSATDRAGPWLPLINEEDWEYDCRIAALGGRLIYVNEFVSIQYSHASHLSGNGTTDPIKLRDRCTAREHMYLSATNSVIPIPDSTMQFFSKSVFLLARECAAQNLGDCAARMLHLANTSRGNKSVKQLVFTSLAKTFGWPRAAKIAELVQ